MESLKEKIIATVINECERFYIHAAPHEDLIIGKRGLIGNEQENGIVLLINDISSFNFAFHKDGISVSLRFSGIWEDTFVPFDAIDAVLDDLEKPKFVFNFLYTAPKKKKLATVVKPDFTKKRPQK